MKDINLSDVWKQQEDYNHLIKSQRNMTGSEWMINYILGTMTELTELLDETNWRTHRVKRITEFGPNIADELADITKYVFSMWQLMGYTEQDMLSAVKEKSKILHQLLSQEMRPTVTGRNVIMLDLDGVVADFRKGFLNWVSQSQWKDILTINPDQIGLHLDINNSWDYQAYNQAKIQFEQEGGYHNLPLIDTVAQAVHTLYRLNWYVIVYTARPYTTYKRIWADTWTWLQNHNLHVHELHFGYDSRVVAASNLAANNLVVALEDDPTLIRRYEGCGIPVVVYSQPYNETMYLAADTFMILPDYPFWDISSHIDKLSRRKPDNAIRTDGATDAQS